MALEVGEPVDRFIVEAHLGDGGLASVYLVRHQRLGAVSALKVLTSTDEELRLRLLQEGRIQSALRHENIVSVLDVIDIEHKLALQMEYIAGPALDELINFYRPSLEEALELFAGVVAGIAAAHDRGLVHRDLKPANVLLDITDNAVVPKVCDFGIAKAPAEGESTMTRPGQAMGTPAYMAPEQVHANDTVDLRADIFSLGAILYELVCGDRAFKGDNMLAVLNAVYASDYVDPRQLRPDLPDNVVQAIRAALHQSPDERPADARAFARILYQLPEDEDPLMTLPRSVSRDAPLFEAAKALKLKTPAPAPARAHSDASISHPPARSRQLTLGASSSRRDVIGLVVAGAIVAVVSSLLVGYMLGQNNEPPTVQDPLPLAATASNVENPPDGADADADPDESETGTDEAATDDEDGAGSDEAGLPEDPNDPPNPTVAPKQLPPPPAERPKRRHWPKVSVDGLSERTILKAGTEEFELPDKVPPGNWQIFVSFDGELASAGWVSLKENEDAVLLCSVVDRKCRVK